MSALILNRDLLPNDVPMVRYADVEPEVKQWCGHPWAWNQLRRFALTFDPAAYAEKAGALFDPATSPGGALRTLNKEGKDAAGTPLPGAPMLAQFRAALWLMFPYADAPPFDNPGLIELVLDGIYRDVSGGQQRPRPDAGPFEPALGRFAARYGSGQHRFSVSSDKALSREALFDRVAGIVLRDISEPLIVSALFLYPPTYLVETDDPPTHAFSMLLQWRERGGGDDELEREYERLAQLCIDAIADTGR